MKGSLNLSIFVQKRCVSTCSDLSLLFLAEINSAALLKMHSDGTEVTMVDNTFDLWM